MNFEDSSTRLRKKAWNVLQNFRRALRDSTATLGKVETETGLYPVTEDGHYIPDMRAGVAMLGEGNKFPRIGWRR